MSIGDDFMKSRVKCPECGMEIRKCDNIYCETNTEFRDGDTVICMNTGEKHFCCDRCLIKHLVENVDTNETYAEQVEE
jgi:endogenous inhibitor of DNA gyrase (YacG/DUF329 family)